MSVTSVVPFRPIGARSSNRAANGTPDRLFVWAPPPHYAPLLVVTRKALKRSTYMWQTVASAHAHRHRRSIARGSGTAQRVLRLSVRDRVRHREAREQGVLLLIGTRAAGHRARPPESSAARVARRVATASVAVAVTGKRNYTLRPYKTMHSEHADCSAFFRF